MISTTITVIETGWWLTSKIVKIGKWFVYGTPESPNDKIIKELERIRHEIEKLKSGIANVNNNNEEIHKKINYYTEYTKILEDSILEPPIKIDDTDQKWIYPQTPKYNTDLIQSCRF